MTIFQAKRVKPTYQGKEDAYVDLVNTQTGEMARIGDRGASLRQLIFNYGTQRNPIPVNVVYGALDWLDLKIGRQRKLVPRDYTEEELAEAHRLRLTYPTLIEGATIDIANRTKQGKAVCPDPVSGKIYTKREWGVNHTQSNSFIHGNAPRTIFAPEGIKERDSFASVTYDVRIGVGLKYFSDVRVYITFILDEHGLKEMGSISNVGRSRAAVAFGRHHSFRIGREGLERHVLAMDVAGALDTDAKLNPNGSIIPFEQTIFGLAGNKKGISLGNYQIDTTFLLRGKTATLTNTKTGHGLEITADDPFTRMCTVWTNELGDGIEGLHRQHTAIEFLVGTHAAALSLPNEERFAGQKGPDIIGQIPNALRQLVLKPDDEIEYTRIYKKIFAE